MRMLVIFHWGVIAVTTACIAGLAFYMLLLYSSVRKL